MKPDKPEDASFSRLGDYSGSVYRIALMYIDGKVSWEHEYCPSAMGQLAPTLRPTPAARFIKAVSQGDYDEVVSQIESEFASHLAKFNIQDPRDYQCNPVN